MAGHASKCQHYVMFIRTIVSASGINITMKPYVTQYYNYTKIPQIFRYVYYVGLKETARYSSPMLNHYEYPSIIYCFNLARVTVVETNMWTTNVPLEIWSCLGVCLVLMSILNPNTYSQLKFMFLLQRFALFASSFLKLIRIFLRQSWCNKWEILGVFELLSSSLICLYENAITVNAVKPLVPKPFLSTLELYNNNYTFVVQSSNFRRGYGWLNKKYNRTNGHRIIEEVNFYNLSGKWLEKYFLNHHNGIKYALVGHMYKHGHYRAVTFVKEKNDTCYQLFPTEKAFSPEPFYFHFTSAVAASLRTAVSRLQGAGFLQVFLASKNFRENLIAVTSTRPLIAKYENEAKRAHLRRSSKQQTQTKFDYIGQLKVGSLCRTSHSSIC